MSIYIAQLFELSTSEDEDAMDEDPAPPAADGDDDLAKYNLDNYDKESKSIGKFPRSYIGLTTDYFLASGPFSNIKGLTYYKDNEEDPYITLKEVSN